MAIYGQEAAAPAPGTRAGWVLGVQGFCSEAYGGTRRMTPCGLAFTESRTVDDVRRRLLCVAGSPERTTPEEPNPIAECSALVRGLTYDQAVAPGSIVRQTYGNEAVDRGMAVVDRAAGLLAAFVPPGGFAPATRPGRPARAPPPTPAPAAAPAAAPMPPPTPAPTLASALLHCLRGANLPTALLDAVIATQENLEQVHVAGEADKIDEMCHQIQDAGFAIRGLLRPSEEPMVTVELKGHPAPEVPALEAFYKCLCPRGSEHTSLLQALIAAAAV